MRNVLLIVCCALLFCVSFSQAIYAQSDSLIPEKKAEETIPAKSSADDSSAKEKSEEPAWGITVISLLLGGFVFLFLEIAIIPGFGAAGIIGLLLLAGGIVLSFMKLTLNMAIAATMGAVTGLFLLLLWFFYVFPHTTFGKKFVLESKSSVEDGCVAVRDLSQYVGKEGVAASMLRPSGIAKIGDERLDVITDCEYLKKGTKIKVIKAKAVA